MYGHDAFKTVAAVSTPRGKGGIAVIRISGGDTAAILDKCFRPAGKPLAERAFIHLSLYEDLTDGEAAAITG